MIDVIEDREVWRLNLELLPPQPSRKKKKEEEKNFILGARKMRLVLLLIENYGNGSSGIETSCKYVLFTVARQYDSVYPLGLVTVSKIVLSRDTHRGTS